MYCRGRLAQMVEHPLSVRKAGGSIPSVSIFFLVLGTLTQSSIRLVPFPFRIEMNLFCVYCGLDPLSVVGGGWF